MAVEFLYLGNDTWVRIPILTDNAGDPVEDAVVHATLFDADGDPVGGQVWPLVLPHVAGGLYEVILDKAVEVVNNGQYEMKYTAVSGVLDGEFWNKVTALKWFP